MWSWLIPQTENLIEYFGAATVSCSATSYTTPASPDPPANAIPDNPAITPAEPIAPLAALFRNALRPTSSALIALVLILSRPTGGPALEISARPVHTPRSGRSTR